MEKLHPALEELYCHACGSKRNQWSRKPRRVSAAVARALAKSLDPVSGGNQRKIINEIAAALMKIERGFDAERFFKAATPKLDPRKPRRDDYYRQRGKDVYCREGEIEIDHDAVISYGDEAGAYVQAWVWVDDEHEIQE